MTTIYGNRWTSQYGDKDDGTWQWGLSGVEWRAAAQALGRLVKRGDGWPPSLPEFRMMCRYPGGREFGLNYVPEVYRKENRPERLLTGPRDNERGRAEIAKLKELLAGKNKAPSEDEALSASRTVTTTAMHEEHSRGNT